MTEDDPVAASVTDVAILRAQVGALFDLCERQNAVITRLLAQIKRVDQQLQLELVALRPSPDARGFSASSSSLEEQMNPRPAANE